MITASQISTIINEIHNGVERSKVGSVLNKKPTGELILGPEGTPTFNSLAYNTYLRILESVFPKNLSIDVSEKTK